MATAVKKEVNSLQNLFYMQLKEILTTEDNVKSHLSKIQKSANEKQVQNFLKEMRDSSDNRIKGIKEIFKEINEEMSYAPKDLSNLFIKDVTDMIQKTTHSVVLDVSVLSTLGKYLGYLEESYEILYSHAVSLKNYPQTKKQLKKNISNIQSIKKHLHKYLEGGIFKKGIEDKAFEKSPIVTSIS